MPLERSPMSTLSRLFGKRMRPRVLPKRRGLHAWESLGRGLAGLDMGLEHLESRMLLAADLAVTISDAHVYYMPGTQTTYKVEVSNIGDATATNATVTSLLGSPIMQKTWTAVYSTGSSGLTSGSGNLNTQVTLAAGGKVTFNVIATIGPTATGPLVSTATATLAGEPNTANNTATDTNQFVPKSIVLTDDAGWDSTSVARVVDPVSGAVRARFQVYEPGYRGGMQSAMADLDGDGRPEIVFAPGKSRVGEIRVFSLDGVELRDYRTLPFGPQWRGGVNLAAADIDGDHRDDIIAAQAFGPGEVRVFRSVAAADPIEDVPYRTIKPFAASYLGGSTVAAADMGTFSNGAVVDAGKQDGRAEVLVGNGPFARPNVRVYDMSPATPAVVDTIRPLSAAFVGGVTLATARINADSIPEVIVTAARSGGGVTEVHNGRVGSGANTRLSQFEAFGALGRSAAPVFVTPLDTDGDGVANLLYASQGFGGGGNVRILSTAGAVTGSLGSLTGPAPTSAPASATNPAIVTTASGLQYIDIKAGTGAVAAVNKTLGVHYVGTLLDGTKFDSSRDRGTPFSFKLGTGAVIKGWDEGLLGLKVGSIRQLIIPTILAYGAAGSGIIPPNATIVFDVEVLSVT